MLDKVNLIKSLIKKLDRIPQFDFVDANGFKDHAEMIIIKVFGSDSNYIPKIKSIHFFSISSGMESQETIYDRKNKAWTDAVRESLNLIDTMLNDLEIASDSEGPRPDVYDKAAKEESEKLLNPKKTWNNWELIKPLGQSGQKQAYEVIDKSGKYKGRFVLKVVKEETGTQGIERFKREIETRMKLKNEGIPKIVDFDKFKSEPFFVEEHVDGGDLEQVRSRICTDPVTTLKYFIQICDIVDYAHRKEIVHRDLKPANILYDHKNDTLKVTDFGICFHLEADDDSRLTNTDEPVGPSGFMSPEHQQGRVEDISFSSDIYVLGKLLYWMLSGKKLYREKHRHPKYNLYDLTGNRQLERVNELLDIMIVEEPEERLQSLEVVTMRLRRIVPLIEKEFNLVSSKINQKCIYCGQGSYKLVVAFDPNTKTNEPNAFTNSKSIFSNYGFKLSNDLIQHIFRCDFCGHVQLFVRDAGNQSWEGKQI